MLLLSAIFIMSWYRFFIPPESMIDTTYYGGHDNLDAKKETNNLGEEKIEKIDEDYEHLASTIKDDWRDVYIWIFLEVPKRSEIYTTKCLYNLPI